jgi:predicted AAA+ superfamily ATPase
MQYYSAMPNRLLETLEAYPDKKCIVLDEIQRVPELLFIVHLVLEQKRGYQFILTGSSARKLKRDGADLLAGRAIMRKMHPFC